MGNPPTDESPSLGGGLRRRRSVGVPFAVFGGDDCCDAGDAISSAFEGLDGALEPTAGMSPSRCMRLNRCCLC